jgi:VanZ family protein
MTRLEAWLSEHPVIGYWLPPVVWMTAIFALSAQTDLPDASRPTWDLLLKKGGHMAEYAILLWLLWRPISKRTPFERPLGLAWLLAVLYAVSDEFHQTFVPGRNGWIWDVIVDGAGASLAALGIWFRTRRRQ